MELTIIQALIIGAIQGITEWLPVGSSGILSLFLIKFLGETNINVLVETALFFHLGTFFAALIYFRSDVKKLFRTLFKYRYSGEENKKILNFIIIATIISGILGFILLKLLNVLTSSYELTGKVISIFIAVLLLFTGIIQIKIKNKGLKNPSELKKSDSILLGILQGIAVLPGISRLGITAGTLLLKNFTAESALKLSFLLSLPIILIGNIVLNFPDLVYSSSLIYGLVASFVFGILTISGIMKLSEKINFGWFVIIFAILIGIGVLI